MKKIGYLEIFVVFLVLLLLGLYFIPKAALSLEKRKYAAIQTNAAMMTSKILSEFSDNTNKEEISKLAEKIVIEMNKIVKNPLDKKLKAYSINEECLGCIVVTSNDKEKNIILSAKDKEDKLIVRTIIQPPSYVTFNKDLNKDEKKHFKF